MDNAKDNAVFMHCLPAFHDLKTKIGKEIHEKYGLTEMEVTDEAVSYTHLRLYGIYWIGARLYDDTYDCAASNQMCIRDRLFIF